MNSKSMTAREKIFNEAANNLKRFTEINNSENIANINKKQVAKVTVTVDGTWQKCGHNSKIAVVFILPVDTQVKCFGTVKEESEKLGIGYDIVKEECVRHIQKQLGTALRQLKLRMQGTKLADGKMWEEVNV